jgi:adenylyltransferase/sulfurtransferase
MTTDLLTNRELRRYKNQIELPEISQKGQENIKKTKVLIVGAGALGTFVMQNLVAAGIGTLGIVDKAMVEESNIHKQCVYGTSDLGKQKAIITKQKLHELNAQAEINIHNLCISFANLDNISANYDIIVDTSNLWETNLAIWNYCAQYNKPLIYGRVKEFNIETGVFTDPQLLYAHIDKKGEMQGGTGFICPVAGLAGSIVSLEIVKLIVGKKSKSINKEKKFNVLEFLEG